MALGQWHDADVGGRLTHGGVLLCLVGKIGVGDTSPGYAALPLTSIHEIRQYLWLTPLLLSLAGIFAGIGLRVQVFFWLGLVTFVLDVLYQLGRMGAESSLAKWGIMLVLGILLVLFVALNEKKKIVQSLKVFYDGARGWE